MSVTKFSNTEISIVGAFAEQIKLGDAISISAQLAKQNLEAFNTRHPQFAEEYLFSFVPDAKLNYGRSITSLICDLNKNSFLNKEETETDLLLSRILTNSIAIEFGDQDFDLVIGTQCRVKYNYNLINYIVGELKQFYRIASYDEDTQVFRLFNAQKGTVTLLGCHQLSKQQVKSLVFKIEQPILNGNNLLIENSTLVAYKNQSTDLFTIKFKKKLTGSMTSILEKFSAKNIMENTWQVSDDIFTLLRELCPKGIVFL